MAGTNALRIHKLGDAPLTFRFGFQGPAPFGFHGPATCWLHRVQPVLASRPNPHWHVHLSPPWTPLRVGHLVWFVGPRGARFGHQASGAWALVGRTGPTPFFVPEPTPQGRPGRYPLFVPIGGQDQDTFFCYGAGHDKSRCLSLTTRHLLRLRCSEGGWHRGLWDD